MQPPTKAIARRHGDEDDLYRRHHRELHRAVASAVSAPRELIEDACQAAWAALLRSQPERYVIFGWLRTVAIHEAYRLSAIERRDARLERLARDEGDWQEITADPRSLDDALEAREALRILASLPERQRQDLTLLVAGFSYRRSANSRAAGHSANVNKQLAKARARVRLTRLRGSARK
jgi:DNA-directed RNA polymerase specialized sigma24 family protein